jgi:hypothetical protein
MRENFIEANIFPAARSKTSSTQDAMQRTLSQTTHEQIPRLAGCLNPALNPAPFGRWTLRN